MELLNIIEQKKIDYDSLIKQSYVRNSNSDKKYSISVIIPVHGRMEFNNIVCEYLLKAAAHIGISISVTIVEHSNTPQHKHITHKDCNYIWVQQGGYPFNKCLCFNVGAIAFQDCDFYLFHDVDTIVPIDFFKNVFFNRGLDRGLGDSHLKDSLQTFTKRRLLHCNYVVTQKYLNGLEYADFNPNKDTVPSNAGAAGGSIFTTKEAYINAGGWDDCLFSQYSIEDQMFFDKLHLTGNFGFCDNPAIELLHLWHEPSFNRTTKQEDRNHFNKFDSMSHADKLIFINKQKEYLLKYFDKPKEKEIVVLNLGSDSDGTQFQMRYFKDAVVDASPVEKESSPTSVSVIHNAQWKDLL